jgi:hypothetical protein
MCRESVHARVDLVHTRGRGVLGSCGRGTIRMGMSTSCGPRGATWLELQAFSAERNAVGKEQLLEPRGTRIE